MSSSRRGEFRRPMVARGKKRSGEEIGGCGDEKEASFRSVSSPLDTIRRHHASDGCSSREYGEQMRSKRMRPGADSEDIVAPSGVAAGFGGMLARGGLVSPGQAAAVEAVTQPVSGLSALVPSASQVVSAGAVIAKAVGAAVAVGVVAASADLVNQAARGASAEFGRASSASKSD